MPASSEPVLLRINDVAFGGSGVGRAESKVYFVPYTIDGELVRAEIIEDRQRYTRALITEIVETSPFRVAAPCPYFEACGGCDYQHIAYEHQLSIKRSQVSQALQRIGHVKTPVEPVQASPLPYRFRNRLTVHSDGRSLGFFRKNSRTIIDVEHCLLGSPLVNEGLTRARQRWHSAGTHLTIRVDDDRQTFTQTNDLVAALLLKYVETQVAGPTLLDAYCGAGFFSHACAPLCTRTVGVEWNQRAIDWARKQAFPNEEYHCGDVARLLPDLISTVRPDTLIFDPPATGLGRRIPPMVNSSKVPLIIYVSCDPTTFARDLLALNQYQILKVQPFDMFPQTAEIELVGTLCLKK